MQKDSWNTCQRTPVNEGTTAARARRRKSEERSEPGRRIVNCRSPETKTQGSPTNRSPIQRKASTLCGSICHPGAMLLKKTVSSGLKSTAIRKNVNPRVCSFIPTRSNRYQVGPMSESPSREEIAARLEAVEARTDTKFAQILGEMRTGFAVIDTRLSSLDRSTAGTKMTLSEPLLV
jgi:hypothetical protein